MRLSTAAQMRECDRLTIEEIGLPGVALMESAGRGAADVLLVALAARGVRGGRVGVFCGGGNNGGDGFVIARQLCAAGHRPHVVLMGPKEATAGDAGVNLRVLERIIEADLAAAPCVIDPWGDKLRAGQKLADLFAGLPRLDAVVDALLGTGLGQPVRGPILELIGHLNELGALTLAVDIPSGVSSDSGAILGDAVRADITATFGLAKIGHVVYPGRALCGALKIVDIGIPEGVYDLAGIRAEALTVEVIRAALPRRPATGHKGTFGHVLALGGSPGKLGALMLCAKAALRAGAGLVTAAGSTTALTQVSTAYPEVMTVAILPDSDEVKTPVGRLERAAEGKVVAAGPGLGTSVAARDLVQHLLLRCNSPLVLDADALNVISAVAAGAERRMLLRAASSRLPVVLTPHPGEFARLIDGDVEGVLRDPITPTRRFAEETGCVVALKMASTLVVHPDGRLSVNTSGNAGMGSGGSGDVLTGVIAALLAQGLDGWDAARIGVFVHGLSGDVIAERSSQRSLVASDLIEHLGEAFRRCETT